MAKDDLYSADFLLATLTPATSTETSSSSGGTQPSASLATPVLLRHQKSRGDRSSLASANSSMAVRPTPPATTTTTTTSSVNRFNSLSLIEPQLPIPEEEEPIHPPPTKRARARYIFQRCLKSSQNITGGIHPPMDCHQVYAPPSDSEQENSN